MTAGLRGEGRVLGHCRSIWVPQGRDGAAQTGVHWGAEATLACARERAGTALAPREREGHGGLCCSVPRPPCCS